VSFIQTYCFRAEIRKAALMGFLATVPPEYYCFVVPPAGEFVLGCFMSGEVMEYFTNEFPVRSLQLVTPDILRQQMKVPGINIWGEKGLI
jgi:hypothetical protein